MFIFTYLCCTWLNSVRGPTLILSSSHSKSSSRINQVCFHNLEGLSNAKGLRSLWRSSILHDFPVHLNRLLKWAVQQWLLSVDVPRKGWERQPETRTPRGRGTGRATTGSTCANLRPREVRDEAIVDTPTLDWRSEIVVRQMCPTRDE